MEALLCAKVKVSAGTGEFTIISRRVIECGGLPGQISSGAPSSNFPSGRPSILHTFVEGLILAEYNKRANNDDCPERESPGQLGALAWGAVFSALTFIRSLNFQTDACQSHA